MSCVFVMLLESVTFIAALWSPEGKRADLLAIVRDVNCDFVTFPFSMLGQVFFFIVSIPDPCCLSYSAYS